MTLTAEEKYRYTWAGWAEAFTIFAKYHDESGNMQHVAAEHDEIYAGPAPRSVEPSDRKRLRELGWHPSVLEDCWKRFT